jgi:hypothetical protein
MAGPKRAQLANARSLAVNDSGATMLIRPILAKAAFAFGSGTSRVDRKFFVPIGSRFYAAEHKSTCSANSTRPSQPIWNQIHGHIRGAIPSPIVIRVTASNKMKIAARKVEVNTGQNNLHVGRMNVRGADDLGDIRRVDEHLGIAANLYVSDGVGMQTQVAGPR